MLAAVAVVGTATGRALLAQPAPAKPPRAIPAARPAAAVAAPATAQLSLEDLGLRTGLEFRGHGSTQTLAIPVNPGLVPEALELEVEPSPLLAKAVLRISTGSGRLLGFAALDGGARVEVSLAGAELQGGYATVVMQLVTERNEMCAEGRGDEIAVRPSSTVRFRVAAPVRGAVAEVLPPYLQHLVLSVPEKPTPAAAQVVLWAGVQAGRLYLGRPVTIEVRPRAATDSAPAAETPWTRVIAWRDGAETEVLPNGTLVVGRLDEARQLLTSRLGRQAALGVALRTEASVPDTATTRSDRLPLRALGAPIAAPAGLPTTLRFSLADLGAHRYPTSVHLLTRQSVANEQGSASLQVRLNGFVIGSSRITGAEGDVEFAVPSQLLRRDNELTTLFSYTRRNACTIETDGFGGTVLGSSEFRLAQGDALVPGFDRFPQAALPELSVQLSPLAWGATQQAAQLLAAMQATTRQPLVATLVEGATPLAGPLLAVGDLGLAVALKAPVATPGFRVTDRAGQQWLRFDPKTPYAALEAFDHEGRDVLLLASGSPALGDSLVAEALAASGWYGLSGDVAVRGPHGHTMPLVLRGTDLQVQALPEAEPAFLERWWGRIVGGALAVLLLILYYLFPRVVRRESPGTAE